MLNNGANQRACVPELEQREWEVYENQLLSRQASFYRQAMISMSDGVAIFQDTDLPRVIECNDAFVRMLGYDRPEEVVGLHPWEIDAALTREAILDMPRPEGGGFQRERFETLHKRRDGSLYDAEVTMTDFEIDGYSCSIAIVRDITDIKRAQKAREASELRATLAAEGAGIGIWAWEIMSRNVSANKEFCSILDIDPADMTTEQDWIARAHPDDRYAFQGAIKNCQDAEKGTFSIELRMRCGNNRYKWTSFFGKVIERDHSGQALRAIGTIRDIDARKSAEEELRQREELLSAIFDKAPGAVLLLDATTHQIVRFNDHAAIMHGYSAEEFASIAPESLRVSPKPPEFEGWWGQLERPGEVTFEGIHRRKDGSNFEVQISSTLITIGKSLYALTIWVDISELKKAERESRQRQDLLSAVFGHTRGGLLLFDEDTWEIENFNDHAATMHGYSREEFIQLDLNDLKVNCTPEVIEERRHLIETRGEITFEDVHRRKDGSTFDLQIRADRIQIDGRNYALALWTDVSELKTAQRALVEQKEEIQSLVEHSPDGMVRYDRDLNRVYVNAAMRNFVGDSANELLGERLQKPANICQPDVYVRALKKAFHTGRGSGQFEMALIGLDGSDRWGLVSFVPERNASGEVATVLMTMRDITSMVEHRKRVHQLAYCDVLTGLANRNAFNEQFSNALTECHRDGAGAALLVFDLDRFKDINDTLGHAAGDELLHQIGARLSAGMRREDIVARLGGDEFAIVLAKSPNKQDIEVVLERIRRAFLKPFDLGQREVISSVTIGIAHFPDDGRSADELLAHADAALYSAKAAGRGGVQFYSPRLTAEARQRLALLTDLRSALRNEEFELLYQPKFALSDASCVGAEALLRWRHPLHGLISPDAFIPLAEETGSIVEIGRWVLREACRVAAEWNHASDSPLRMAVNLSSRQFIANDIVSDIRNALANTGCRGEWLECEITESLILHDDTFVLRGLEEIRSLGTTVAIDDFGTGQAALSYLDRFHVDVLKIDRSFISNQERDPRKTELVKAFISMAKALEMETVAEGIENREQMEILQKLGCQFGQGYYFSKPISNTQFRQDFLGLELLNVAEKRL